MANCNKPRKTAHGAKAINYILGGKDGKGHNGNEKRNELVFVRNMHRGESYISQMRRHWDLASEQHTNQVITMAFGFSKNELPPENENSPYIAAIITNGFIEHLEEKEFLPKGHQILFAVQKDGKGGKDKDGNYTGGKIHVHLAINDVNSITHRGAPNELNWGPFLTKEFQSYCEKAQLFQVDYGKGHNGENYTQAERVRREQGKPVFKDIFRNRIKEAIDESDNYDEFLQNLNNKSITLESKITKKGQKRYNYIVDENTVPDDMRPETNNYSARSTSLGSMFLPDAIKTYFTLKKQVSQQQEQNAVKEPVVSSTTQSGSNRRQSLLEEAASTTSIDLDSLNNFMVQYFDYFKDITDVNERTDRINEAYEEFKTTGKVPGEGEEVSDEVSEPIDDEVEADEPIMVPVTSDEDDEEQIEESVEIDDDEDLQAIYYENKRAMTLELKEDNNTIVRDLMRKAERIPDLPSGGDIDYKIPDMKAHGFNRVDESLEEH